MIYKYFIVALIQFSLSSQSRGAACDDGYLENILDAEYSDVYIVTPKQGTFPMKDLAFHMSVFLIHKKVNYLPLTFDLSKDDCGLAALLRSFPSDICLCYVPSNCEGYDKIQALKSKSRACWVDELPVMNVFDDIVLKHFNVEKKSCN